MGSIVRLEASMLSILHLATMPRLRFAGVAPDAVTLVAALYNEDASDALFDTVIRPYLTNDYSFVAIKEDCPHVAVCSFGCLIHPPRAIAVPFQEMHLFELDPRPDGTHTVGHNYGSGVTSADIAFLTLNAEHRREHAQLLRRQLERYGNIPVLCGRAGPNGRVGIFTGWRLLVDHLVEDVEQAIVERLEHLLPEIKT